MKYWIAFVITSCSAAELLKRFGNIEWLKDSIGSFFKDAKIFLGKKLNEWWSLLVPILGSLIRSISKYFRISLSRVR